MSLSNNPQFRALARLGAQLKLRELQVETDRIRATFPQLAPTAEATAKSRRTMSPAERQAVSRRMRAYWRARREAAR